MEGSSSIGEAYPTSQLDNSGRSRDSYYDDIYHKASIDPPNQHTQQQQHNMYSRSNYQSNTSNNMDSMRSSGITSSHPSETTSYNYSGTTNSSSFRSRTTNNTSTTNNTTRTGPSYFQPMTKDISLSGNPLTHVTIPEDEDLELDKDEMRKLANSTKENEDTILTARSAKLNSDDTTIATTLTTQRNLINNRVHVDGDPTKSILHPDYIHEPLTDVEKKRAKMKQLIFSPPFRRTLFIGICFLLLVVGVILTIENFMHPKTREDWIEPNRDKFVTYGGGINWSFGYDAPKRQDGAKVDKSIEYNIADWSEGTVRITTSRRDTLDGYGSITLSEDDKVNDIPLFWGLSFAGGTIMESVAGQCLKFTQASDGKGMEDHKEDTIDEMNLSTILYMGEKYINVNLSTPGGIWTAQTLGLVTSGMADIIYSPLLHEISELFTPTNQGRLFIMVRHPVEREFARFRELKTSRDDDSVLTKEEKEQMTYAMFAESEYVVDNWMTRTLVQKGQNEQLTARDMYTSKEILRRKAVIGLYSDINGAIRKYARYFGWDAASNGDGLNKSTLTCLENAISEGLNKDENTGVLLGLVEDEAKEGSKAWKRILDKNRYDYELFVYAQHLYKYQTTLN